nr:hypothetical protein HmN_000952700 [Hymenolepis microstoma]
MKYNYILRTICYLQKSYGQIAGVNDETFAGVPAQIKGNETEFYIGLDEGGENFTSSFSFLGHFNNLIGKVFPVIESGNVNKGSREDFDGCTIKALEDFTLRSRPYVYAQGQCNKS